MIDEMVRGLSDHEGRRLNSALGHLLEIGATALEVARAGLWLYGPDGDRLHRIHLFHRSSGEHVSGGELRREHFPAYFEALDGEPLIAASDVHSDPRTSEFSDTYAGPLGLNAWIDAPVRGDSADDSPRGIVRFEQLGPSRGWTGTERRLAVEVGALAGALLVYFERRRAREESSGEEADEARVPARSPVDEPGPATGEGGDEGPAEGDSTGGERPRPAADVMATMVRHSPAALGLVDRQGEVLSCNPAMSDLFGGRESADLEGALLSDRFLRPSQWDDVSDRMGGSGRIDGWEIRVRRLDGKAIWVLLSAVEADATSVPSGAMVLTAVDITERHAVRERLERQANRDPLTGAANRRLLQETAENTLALAQRHGRQAALLYVDLRRFKEINDMYGHEVGDRVLTHVADRLRARGRESDLTARIGGDEFAVLLAEVEDGIEGGRRAAERLMEALSPPIKVGDLSIDIDVTIGVALYPDHGRDIQTLLRRADQAMYRGKTSESGKIVVCREESAEGEGTPETGEVRGIREGGRDRRRPSGSAEPAGGDSVETVDGRLLEDALEEDRLELFWQPIQRRVDGVRVGVEALLRLNHPTRNRLRAEAFLSRAEELDWIEPFDRWVLNRAARRLPGWLEEDRIQWIALNVSARSLLSPDYIEALEERVRRDGVAPHTILLQTTIEPGHHHPLGDIGRALTTLQQQGFGISLDLDAQPDEAIESAFDAIPMDMLEVSPRFLGRLEDGPVGSLVEDLRREQGLGLLAKQVETAEQHRRARRAECELLVGRFLGREVPAADLWAGTT